MESPDQSVDEGRSSVSLPIILVALAVAAIAALGVGYVFLSRDDDDAEPVTLSTPLITTVDLAAPRGRSGDTSSLVHLIVEPVTAGENQISVRFSEQATGSDPVSIPMESVEVFIGPLAGDASSQALMFSLQDDGSWVGEEPVELGNGWWEATVTLSPPGEDPTRTIFYLMAPDPNINGFDNVPAPGSSDDAQAVFDAGMERWQTLHSMKYIERLTSGQGEVSVSQREVTDGFDGNPAATRMLTSQFELLTIDDTTWQRTPGSDWIERTYVDPYPPQEWLSLYEGATDFVLGNAVAINDRDTDVVMFHVPETDTLVAAWYTWWVDRETGYVIREAMISQLHYMIYEFGEFNSSLVFEPPAVGSSPVASPPASPVGE